MVFGVVVYSHTLPLCEPVLNSLPKCALNTGSVKINTETVGNALCVSYRFDAGNFAAGC